MVVFYPTLSDRKCSVWCIGCEGFPNSDQKVDRHRFTDLNAFKLEAQRLVSAIVDTSLFPPRELRQRRTVVEPEPDTGNLLHL